MFGEPRLGRLEDRRRWRGVGVMFLEILDDGDRAWEVVMFAYRLYSEVIGVEV